MSPAAVVAYTVLFFVAWGGLAVLVVIGVVRTVRDQNRRAERGRPPVPIEEPRPRLDVLA